MLGVKFMSIRSDYLTEEAGMHECFGKSFREYDIDCEECDNRIDCKNLTNLRKLSKAKVAKRSPTPKSEYRNFASKREEEEEEYWESDETQVPKSWITPQPPAQIQYPHNTQFIPPGMHSSAHIIPHPAPHLTYMVSNPVDCPMPIVGETWYARIGKNVLSGALSEGGRQIYEYFRRFRF